MSANNKELISTNSTIILTAGLLTQLEQANFNGDRNSCLNPTITNSTTFSSPDLTQRKRQKGMDSPNSLSDNVSLTANDTNTLFTLTREIETEMVFEHATKRAGRDRLRALLLSLEEHRVNSTFPSGIPRAFTPFNQLPAAATGFTEEYQQEQLAAFDNFCLTLLNLRIKCISDNINLITAQLSTDYSEERYKSRVRDKCVFLKTLTIDQLEIVDERLSIAGRSYSFALSRGPNFDAGSVPSIATQAKASTQTASSQDSSQQPLPKREAGKRKGPPVTNTSSTIAPPARMISSPTASQTVTVNHLQNAMSELSKDLVSKFTEHLNELRPPPNQRGLNQDTRGNRNRSPDNRRVTPNQRGSNQDTRRTHSPENRRIASNDKSNRRNFFRRNRDDNDRGRERSNKKFSN